jgi:hypothetical protein
MQLIETERFDERLLGVLHKYYIRPSIGGRQVFCLAEQRELRKLTAATWRAGLTHG